MGLFPMAAAILRIVFFGVFARRLDFSLADYQAAGFCSSSTWLSLVGFWYRGVCFLSIFVVISSGTTYYQATQTSVASVALDIT